ncbi:unnamed protein product [Victoria cruziana]
MPSNLQSTNAASCNPLAACALPGFRGRSPVLIYIIHGCGSSIESAFSPLYGDHLNSFAAKSGPPPSTTFGSGSSSPRFPSHLSGSIPMNCPPDRAAMDHHRSRLPAPDFACWRRHQWQPSCVRKQLIKDEESGGNSGNRRTAERGRRRTGEGSMFSIRAEESWERIKVFFSKLFIVPLNVDERLRSARTGKTATACSPLF